MEEPRWKARFRNFKRAISHLNESMELIDEKGINKFNHYEITATGKFFENCFELAWKTLQDYVTELGYVEKGPKPVIQIAFQIGIIEDGNAFMEMLELRNNLSHQYDEVELKESILKIKENYFTHLENLEFYFLQK